jgi:hypothetical protein
MKINCWDFNQCGREHGGNNVERLGKCHSVQYKSFNGINGGLFGGRYCWHIAGTHKSFNGINGGLFGGRYCWHISGTFQDGEPTCRQLKKVKSCDICEFYLIVKKEEGENFVQ